MLEQFAGTAPFVILELPCLPGCEDSHHAVPVFRLELLRALDENESHGAVGVDGSHDALDVEHADRGAARVRGHEFAVFEEGSRIGHSEQ